MATSGNPSEKVWVCYGPNSGRFHVYEERPGTNACDSAYQAHARCGWMQLVSLGAFVLEKDAEGKWPEWFIDGAISYAIKQVEEG